MADVNASSVEDYADRIVYRYAGGRYEQALTTWASAFSSASLLTLVNTDTSRSYVVPRSGLPAKFYKIELNLFSAVRLTDTNVPIGLTLVKTPFFKISIPTLNFDGKSQLTEFYKQDNEQFYTSQQLRSINIGNVLLEPSMEYSNIQFFTGSYPAFSVAAGSTGFIAIVQPTVTMYKK